MDWKSETLRQLLVIWLQGSFSSQKNKGVGQSRTKERIKIGTKMKTRNLMKMRKKMRTKLGSGRK